MWLREMCNLPDTRFRSRRWIRIDQSQKDLHQSCNLPRLVNTLWKGTSHDLYSNVKEDICSIQVVFQTPGRKTPVDQSYTCGYKVRRFMVLAATWRGLREPERGFQSLPVAQK